MTLDGGRATLEDGTLAGSVTPLLPALLRVHQALGIAPEQLWRLGATVPAGDLPLSGLGRVASGAPADLILWSDSGEVIAALRDGERADDPEASEWLPTTVRRIQ